MSLQGYYRNIIQSLQNWSSILLCLLTVCILLTLFHVQLLFPLLHHDAEI